MRMTSWHGKRAILSPILMATKVRMWKGESGETAHAQLVQGNWNDARVNSKFPAVDENIDDITFVNDIIEHSSRVYRTDPCKTFMVGWSNGGRKQLRVWNARSLIACRVPSPSPL